MKIVIVSDVHLDRVTMGKERFEEVERAVWASCHHASEIGAARWMMLGDWTDPDSGSVTIRAITLMIQVAAWLRNHGIESLWLVGNHDVIEDGLGGSVLSPVGKMWDGGSSLPATILLDRAEVFHAFTEQTVLIACPFTPSSHPVDWPTFMTGALNGISNDRHVMIVSHLSMPGVQPGEETTEMPRGREVVFPVGAILGRSRTAVIQAHYHRRQSLVLPDGTPVHVVGSLARLTFAERDHQPGWYDVEVP